MIINGSHPEKRPVQGRKETHAWIRLRLVELTVFVISLPTAGQSTSENKQPKKADLDSYAQYYRTVRSVFPVPLAIKLRSLSQECNYTTVHTSLFCLRVCRIGFWSRYRLGIQMHWLIMYIGLRRLPERFVWVFKTIWAIKSFMQMQMRELARKFTS